MESKEIFEIINGAKTKHELLHEIKPRVLGKDSYISKKLAEMARLTIEEKREVGKVFGKMKDDIEGAFNKKLAELEASEINEKLNSENFDGTVPCGLNSGSIHPITKVSYECINILEKYGFSYYSGAEIEDDWHNFEALNVSKNHPARQMQDTFYLKNSKLLRTHTTSVDIRAILENQMEPPLAVCSFGKVFRVESDATHSPMFHQVELLMVDKDLHLGHLKFIIERFLSDFFGVEDVKLRFRPSFFPFTEPSIEVDLGYYIKNGKIEIGGEEKFLEIGGAGMLHPNVLKNCNIDSSKYSAIAFGMGIERLAMLKYGMTDCRKFSKPDVDWLEHYSFLHSEL